jgi:predicted acetyltransferase
MGLVARLYREGDRDGFAHVRSMVYREGEPVRPDEELLAEDCVGTVVEKDGQIVGAATALDFESTFHAQTVRCAGVAGVGVLPHHRRGGVGSELMRGSNRVYLELGFEMASLYPFRETFYRRFGYETCGRRVQMAVPTHRMPSLSDPLEVRPVPIENAQQIYDCYTAHARRFNGANLRKPMQWKRALGMDKPFAIYAAGDPVEAFALVRLSWEFWKPQEIREVAWSSWQGYESIIAFLSQLGINKTELQWYEAADMPFAHGFMDQGIGIKIERPVMWRILDVAKVVAKLPATGKADLSVEILDPTMPENSGAWHIASDGQQVSVERSNSADLTMTIQHFTQVCMGEPSFQTMAEQGVFGTLSEDTIRAGKSLFPARHVICLDWF